MIRQRPMPGEIAQKLPGQESVWDYPRPPRVEATNKHIQVIFNGEIIADTRIAWRVLETSHPPVYYISPEDISMHYLQRTRQQTVCEWKSTAVYYNVVVGGRTASNAAWSYPEPTPPFAAIKEYVAFYPGKMDQCLVDGECVQPQLGEFYGGWITQDIIGPFKGDPSTWGV